GNGALSGTRGKGQGVRDTGLGIRGQKFGTPNLDYGTWGRFANRPYVRDNGIATRIGKLSPYHLSLIPIPSSKFRRLKFDRDSSRCKRNGSGAQTGGA